MAYLERLLCHLSCKMDGLMTDTFWNKYFAVFKKICQISKLVYPNFSLGTTSSSLNRSNLHLNASLTGTMAVPPDRTNGMIWLSMTEGVWDLWDPWARSIRDSRESRDSRDWVFLDARDSSDTWTTPTDFLENSVTAAMSRRALVMPTSHISEVAFCRESYRAHENIWSEGVTKRLYAAWITVSPG